jgi:hypothetical protein
VLRNPRWIGNYVNGNEKSGAESKMLRPLHEARVEVREIPGKTQLTDVRAGQPVAIVGDTYPGTAVHGVVASPRRADRSSRCCRLITRPAISRSLFSVSRSRS